MAPLTQIVAFFEKKIWGAFWRFSGQKRALPDSKHLATLPVCKESSEKQEENCCLETNTWTKNWPLVSLDNKLFNQTIILLIQQEQGEFLSGLYLSNFFI